MSAPRHVGRYELHGEIASGGMATVHLGRLIGPVGFSRRVAIKRLHQHHARDPAFAAMFIDEARLASRISHPNVVPILELLDTDGELFLVMEYVQGESLAKLLRAEEARGRVTSVSIVVAVLCGALEGLQAAHDAVGDKGDPLHIVHRDVSPQNILVGADGVARVLDFGIAKAADRLQTTREGTLKGKLAYMAPEQLTADKVDRRTDVYAAGIVLWEALTGKRLFTAESSGAVLHQVLHTTVAKPSEVRPGLPEALDAIVARALARDSSERYATARELARALEAASPPAHSREVGAWVLELAQSELDRRAKELSSMESVSRVTEELLAPGATGKTAVPVANAAQPGDSRRSIVAWVVGMAIAAGAFAWLLFTRQAPAPLQDGRAAAAPAVQAPRAPTPAPSPADPPASVAARSTLPAPVTTNQPAPVTAAAGPPHAGKRRAATKSDCRSPYFVDAEGLKRYKPECLK